MRLAVLLTLILASSIPSLAQNTDAPGPNPVAATPAEARLAGAEQRRQLEAASPVAAVPFRSVGPSVMSGRAVGVEGNPNDVTEFYVAYASGGLWHTETSGTTFTPLFDEMPMITIGAIAVDWNDPEGDGPTVWVGTGESNSSRSSYAGTGVYTSTDGGSTWTHRGLAETQHIGRIVLGENGTAHVAAIGHLYSPNPERGVYRTDDSGETWTRTLFVDEETGAIDLVRDPTDPNRIYAATWTRSRRAWDFREAGPGSAIWASDDDGQTYSRLTIEGTGFPTGADVGRIGLAAHPNGVLYAVLDNQVRRPEDEDDEAPELTSEMLETMTREQFLEQSEDAINAFLDANNFPFSYTAETVLEDVREGRIEPIALVEFLADANRQLFDTPVAGAEVYRSDDQGQSWTRTHEGSFAGSSSGFWSALARRPRLTKETSPGLDGARHELQR
ncbi:MAG: sialidase family protein [Bacteroidota bacterium]